MGARKRYSDDNEFTNPSIPSSGCRDSFLSRQPMIKRSLTSVNGRPVLGLSIQLRMRYHYSEDGIDMSIVGRYALVEKRPVTKRELGVSMHGQTTDHSRPERALHSQLPPPLASLNSCTGAASIQKIKLNKTNELTLCWCDSTSFASALVDRRAASGSASVCWSLVVRQALPRLDQRLRLQLVVSYSILQQQMFEECFPGRCYALQGASYRRC